MLTNRPAEKSSASWRFVRGGVAIVASAMTLTSVYAGGVGNMSCVGGPGSVNCVGNGGPAAIPMSGSCHRLSATRRGRRPRCASANGWRNASRSFDAILTVLRAISMRRAAANTALARIRAQSFQTDFKKRRARVSFTSRALFSMRRSGKIILCA